MTKNTRRLLSGMIAVAVLGGAYAALLLHPKEEETNSTPFEELVSMDTDDLASVQVTLRDGSSFTMATSSDDSGTTYTMSGAAENDYSESLMQGLMNAACGISARLVEEDCADPGKYGLSAEDDTDTLVITGTDGTAVTLTIGLSNDLGTYCSADGGTAVYLLDSDTAETLTQAQSYYRNLTVLGGYYSLSDELKSLTIDHMDDGTVVTLSARDISGMDDDTAKAYSQYIFTAPMSCDADDSELSTGLLSGLQSGLTAQSIAEDNPSDLSQYGLDDPIRIAIAASSLDAAILVGDETDDGGIYVMKEGGRTVYLCTASDYSFLEEDWNDWRSTNLMPCALSEVDKITVTEGGETHTVDITHVESDENEEQDEDDNTATLDGEDMTDDALKQFFLAITSVNYTRLVDDPQDAEASATVTLTMNDGSTRSLAFTKGGSREYLVSVNGGAYAYGVPQDDLTSILNALTTGA